MFLEAISIKFNFRDSDIYHTLKNSVQNHEMISTAGKISPLAEIGRLWQSYEQGHRKCSTWVRVSLLFLIYASIDLHRP